MRSVATTRMSSKGQIVIPEEIRKELRLQEGAQFVVLGEKDVVILKILTRPAAGEFNEIIKRARKQAKESKLRKSDVDAAIKKAREK